MVIKDQCTLQTFSCEDFLAEITFSKPPMCNQLAKAHAIPLEQFTEGYLMGSTTKSVTMTYQYLQIGTKYIGPM